MRGFAKLKMSTNDFVKAVKERATELMTGRISVNVADVDEYAARQTEDFFKTSGFFTQTWATYGAKALPGGSSIIRFPGAGYDFLPLSAKYVKQNFINHGRGGNRIGIFNRTGTFATSFEQYMSFLTFAGGASERKNCISSTLKKDSTVNVLALSEDIEMASGRATPRVGGLEGRGALNHERNWERFEKLQIMLGDTYAYHAYRFMKDNYSLKLKWNERLYRLFERRK